MSQYEEILVLRINKYGNKDSHKELRDYFMDQLFKTGLTVKEIETLINNKSAHHWFRYSSDYRIPTSENYKNLQNKTGLFKKDYKFIKLEFEKQKNNFCTYNKPIENTNILYGKLSEKRFHPTQKPVGLLKELILRYSNENDTILDNCMGSGSTGVACINTNRNFIGIELDEIYFNIAKERIGELK